MSAQNDTLVASPAPSDSESAQAPAAATTKDKKGKGKSKTVDDEVLTTDDGPKDIHAKLKRLRQAEVAGLSKSDTNKRSIAAANHYVQRFFLEGGRYVRYVIDTWFGMALSTLFGGLGPFDYFTMWVFAFGGTVVLWFVLWFCLIVNSPILVETYKKWSNQSGGGLGIVNSSNPKLFESLTQEQAEAGKEFLSSDLSKSKDTESERYFNLDGAKLLLQFAAVVYEHPNEAIRNAVDIKAHTPGNANTGGMFSMGGAAEEQAPTQAGVIDEKNPETESAVAAALESKGDDNIRKFCKRFGLDFEPVSELNNTSSAFAGLFWDPKSNWIVVSFKGTSPIEFGEWLSDLNTKMESVGTHIPGFKKVHKGFKDRVYPDEISSAGGIRPYDTISLGIKTLAKWLRKENGFPEEKQINVWFTGHSLGCATASLVYCRFLMRYKDMGKRSVLRDAYLFACPILSDRDTVDVFNAKMMEDKKRPKTMWRITSNGDFVATCLPELGDYTSVAVSPNNAFAFAHLGTEIKLRDHPLPPNATGNHLFFGTDIHIESKFTTDEILAQRAAHMAQPGEKERQRLGTILQMIPLLGRIVAHGAVFYWDQLDRIGLGKKCEWAYN